MQYDDIRGLPVTAQTPTLRLQGIVAVVCFLQGVRVLRVAWDFRFGLLRG